MAWGCSDGLLKVLDVGTGTTLEVGTHTNGLSALVWASTDNQIIATGSWDRTLKV